MRLLVPLVLLLIIVSARLASAGDGCCLCIDCASNPSTCVAPGPNCESVCIEELGCVSFTTGGGGECLAPMCQVTTTAPAPTVSHLGLALTAAGLALVGLARMARRRRAAL